MKDALAMYRRLYSLAYKRFSCDADHSHDLAAMAICRMLETGVDDFSYGFSIVLNKVKQEWRNKKRRKTYQIPLDDDGEPIELPVASSLADADTCLIANECLTAIENLPGVTREVMQLVAYEFTPDEIVEELRLPKSEVYWRTQLGRKLLRQRDGYELERKRGHHKFIGIRKECRRWNATFRSGDESFWLGTFATAAEAAKAYDAKAKEVLGAAAKLNFPAPSPAPSPSAHGNQAVHSQTFEANSLSASPSRVALSGRQDVSPSILSASSISDDCKPARPANQVRRATS